MHCPYFAKKIKELREAAGLTIEAEALELGVNKSRISMWESAGVIPHWEILFTIADYYRVSIDSLLGHFQQFQLREQSLSSSAL